MTLRRLGVLVRNLSYDSNLYAEIQAEVEAAQKPTADLIRERQAHYQSRGH